MFYLTHAHKHLRHGKNRVAALCVSVLFRYAQCPRAIYQYRTCP
jgi:hypothetical protein